MLAVVRAPHTRSPSLEIRGRIPRWMLSRLRREYGRTLVVKDDPEDSVDVFGTSWYKSVSSKRRPGDSLRICRENAELSQAQLGERLGGVPRQNVSAMEEGRRGIGKEMARSLADILHAPLERFI
jgi:DNA-binding XRE family transcriptional regulator